MKMSNASKILFEFPVIGELDVVSSVMEKTGEKFLEKLKLNYDRLKNHEETARLPDDRFLSVVGNQSVPLSQLLIDGFDEEQIWQQLELQNTLKIKTFCKLLHHYVERDASTTKFGIIREIFSSNEEKTPTTDRRSPDNGHSIPIKENEKEDTHDQGSDDLREMEEFLNMEDEKEKLKFSGEDDADGEELGEDEHIDYFEDLGPLGDEVDNFCYSAFFDPPPDETHCGETKLGKRKGQVIFEGDHGDECNLSKREASASFEAKSRLEEKDTQLRQTISALEEENLAPKSWQMVGEISGQKRPENALLEQHLTYENTARLPPVITEDVTAKLEELIKQRIRDQAWDDVERKSKPAMEPQKYRNELVLDQQKSKISLSELYEQEFLKHTKKEEMDACDPKHKEIKQEMKELFRKLDALSNFRYTPKPPVPEVRIVSNTRSLSMEEVAPVTANTYSLLAPEEIKPATTGDLKAYSERDKTEKKRERRKNKQMKKMRSNVKTSSNKFVAPKDKLKALKKIGRIRKAKISDDKQRSITSGFVKDHKDNIKTSRSGQCTKKARGGTYKL